MQPYVSTDMLKEIMIYTSPLDIYQICASNRYTLQICQDDLFWKQKSEHDFWDQLNLKDPSYPWVPNWYSSWKQFYRKRYNLLIPMTIYITPNRKIEKFLVSGGLDYYSVVRYLDTIISTRPLHFAITNNKDEPMAAGFILANENKFIQSINDQKLPPLQHINIYMLDEVDTGRLFTLPIDHILNEVKRYDILVLETGNPDLLIDNINLALERAGY